MPEIPKIEVTSLQPMRTYEQFRDLFPKLFNGCVEIDQIAVADYYMLQMLNAEFLALHNNQYILLADSRGIAEYEKILRIPVDDNEDLEFRRERVLARLVTLPPFTFPYLRQRLDEMVGEGAWTAWIDFDAYTLYVQSFILQKWYHEFQVMMNMIKPANIVFINTPMVASNLTVQEEVRMSQVHWNYILGRWQIDEVTPFANYDDGEVIKMAEVSSITDYCLHITAQEFVERAHHVVLSGDGHYFTQSLFQIQRADNNVGILGYLVYPDQIAHIEHISVQDNLNNVLMQFDADITVLVDNIIRHIIPVEEELDT